MTPKDPGSLGIILSGESCLSPHQCHSSKVSTGNLLSTMEDLFKNVEVYYQNDVDLDLPEDIFEGLPEEIVGDTVEEETKTKINHLGFPMDVFEIGLKDSTSPPRVLPFDTNSFITRTGRRGKITKIQHAFNLLGCLVYMARFPSTREGCEPIFRIYGHRPRIVDQIYSFVRDTRNGVVHDPLERSVSIDKSSLHLLVVGGYTLPDERDRILTYFGGSQAIGVDNFRKYFSNLKTAWELNRQKGSIEVTFLDMFEYVVKGPREKIFKFYY